MDRHNNARCGAQGSKCQKAELRRAVDHHDVVVVPHSLDRSRDTREEYRIGTATLGEYPWRLVLELLQLEVPWDYVQTLKIRRSCDLPQWAGLGIVANCTVERSVRADVELRLVAEQCR